MFCLYIFRPVFLAECWLLFINCGAKNSYLHWKLKMASDQNSSVEIQSYSRKMTILVDIYSEECHRSQACSIPMISNFNHFVCFVGCLYVCHFICNTLWTVVHFVMCIQQEKIQLNAFILSKMISEQKARVAIQVYYFTECHVQSSWCSEFELHSSEKLCVHYKWHHWMNSDCFNVAIRPKKWYWCLQ